jgi:hypothetical protein
MGMQGIHVSIRAIIQNVNNTGCKTKDNGTQSRPLHTMDLTKSPGENNSGKKKQVLDPLLGSQIFQKS